MAKKRRLIKEKPEEEYEFTPSNFDEKEFILKDIYGTKVLFITIVYAVIVGFLAAVICNVLGDPINWVLDTIMVFAAVFTMKKLYMKLGIRADLLESKTMMGDYFVFLVMALGICIVFINQPFLVP
ncbi:hypothetical protein [Methanomethylophilus alvi]|uniref:hypothetical protein n=1 Tax=Methanomethylophilus alvi TaxID=1291540 RepID=UPI0037DD9161